jgi:hypothetical protein
MTPDERRKHIVYSPRFAKVFPNYPEAFAYWSANVHWRDNPLSIAAIARIIDMAMPIDPSE